MKKVTAAFLITFALLFAPLCAVCLSSENKQDQQEIEKEVSLGKRVAESIEKRWERITDPARIAELRMIMNRIVPFMNRELPYDVRMIKEDSINAFSLPGGIIYLTTGMYESAKSDDELAAVISHELVHADHKHVLIQMARNEKLSLVTLAVMIASEGKAAPMVLGSMAQVARSNSYSRDLEREADIVGVSNLHKAGYSPAGMLTLLESLAEEKIKHPWVDPGIYMDHPYVEERIDYIIDYTREQKWPLHRKKSLNLLKVSLVGEEKLLTLAVDGQAIARVADSPENREILEETSRALEEAYQLETMPFDLRVVKNDTTAQSSLFIGNRKIISEPLPEGMASIEQLRQLLLDLLLAAKNRHPVTDFIR